MNRIAIAICAIVTLAIAVANFLLAQNLILPPPVMQQRAGGMPWYITWAMVWVSVACSVALGGFLVAATLKKK